MQAGGSSESSPGLLAQLDQDIACKTTYFRMVRTSQNILHDDDVDLILTFGALHLRKTEKHQKDGLESSHVVGHNRGAEPDGTFRYVLRV